MASKFTIFNLSTSSLAIASCITYFDRTGARVNVENWKQRFRTGNYKYIAPLDRNRVPPLIPQYSELNKTNNTRRGCTTINASLTINDFYLELLILGFSIVVSCRSSFCFSSSSQILHWPLVTKATSTSRDNTEAGW